MNSRTWIVLGTPLVAVGAFEMGWHDNTHRALAEFASYIPQIGELTREHLILSLSSGILAIFTAVPIGIVLSRPRFDKFAERWLQVINVTATVPTIAVLALAMLFLGLGFWPSIFSLYLATLLPIVRNTFQGLKGVNPALMESANGIGMSAMQMLLLVELPSAAYVIFDGIRIAMVINIGTTPLAFLVGGGGLGDLIFTGISLYDTPMMLAGAIPTATLAVFCDTLLAGIALLASSPGTRLSNRPL